MSFARIGWAALLALVSVQACTGDEPAAAPAMDASTSGGTGGAGGDAAVAPDASDAGGAGGNASTDAATADAALEDASDDPDAGTAACEPRAVMGGPEMHFHHVHFNTPDPDEDLAFFERYFDAPPVPFCVDARGNTVTRATRTERAYFLYTKVDPPPDPALNTYLEHVGWVHPMPAAEFTRMLALGVPLYPEGRAQCADAAAGVRACPVPVLNVAEYYFYVQAPSGARIEVALGPGPAMSGFGHVHFIQGEDLSFFTTVSDGAVTASAIDMVNHINAALTEDLLENEMVVDSRGKPIDHIAYSTTDLEAAKARIEAAGIAIAEDISVKPELGFRSFFVRSPKGTWLEVVEDSPFQ